MKLGFSLIELMIVLALISILSLISYPLYNEHVIRVRRAYMAATLLDAAGRMEKYRVLHESYNGANTKNLSIDTSRYHKYYNLHIAPEGDLYILTATPIGKQAKDILCGSLTIDQDGNKSVGSGDSDIKCWL